MLHTIHEKDDYTEFFFEEKENISECAYPISHFLRSVKFSDQYRTFLAAITAGVEPTNFRDAVAIKEWRDAMKKEVMH